MDGNQGDSVGIANLITWRGACFDVLRHRPVFKLLPTVGAEANEVGHWQFRSGVNLRPAFGNSLILVFDAHSGIAFRTDNRKGNIGCVWLMVHRNLTELNA